MHMASGFGAATDGVLLHAVACCCTRWRAHACGAVPMHAMACCCMRCTWEPDVRTWCGASHMQATVHHTPLANAHTLSLLVPRTSCP